MDILREKSKKESDDLNSRMTEIKEHPERLKNLKSWEECKEEYQEWINRGTIN